MRMGGELRPFFLRFLDSSLTGKGHGRDERRQWWKRKGREGEEGEVMRS